jgi:hypothetical protein
MSFSASEGGGCQSEGEDTQWAALLARIRAKVWPVRILELNSYRMRISFGEGIYRVPCLVLYRKGLGQVSFLCLER